MKTATPFPLLFTSIRSILAKDAPAVFEKALHAKSISTDEITHLILPKYQSGKKLTDAVNLLTSIFTAQGIFVTYTPTVTSETLFKKVRKEIVFTLVTESSWQKEANRLLSFYKDIKKLFVSKKDKEVFFYYYGFNKHFKRYSQKEICSLCKIKDPIRIMEIIHGIWKLMNKKAKTISPSTVSVLLKETSAFAAKNGKYLDWETCTVKPLP